MSAKYVRAIVVGFAVAFVISGSLAVLTIASGAGGVGLMQLLPGAVFGAFTAYVLANLAGNRKVADADADVVERARAMRPPSGKALVYAYRDGFVGKAAGLNVQLDGVDLAQLTSPRFTCLAVDPGSHILSAGLGGLAAAQNRAVSANFVAEADGVNVFRFTVAMGALKNSITLEPVADVASVKVKLAGMRMTAPEAATAF